MRFAPLASCLLAGLGLLAAVGCESPAQSRALPALQNRPAIHKVAVAPFGVAPRLAEDPKAPLEADLVAHHLTEAFAARGVATVAPSDVAHMLADAGQDAAQVTPSVAARMVAEKFGADALLVGRLHRWVERQGSAAGATRPATVGFDVTLYGAPDGARLWSSTFDHTQKAAGENVLLTGRYPGRGSRWLTAEELARWGAGEVAAAAPLP